MMLDDCNYRGRTLAVTATATASRYECGIGVSSGHASSSLLLRLDPMPICHGSLPQARFKVDSGGSSS